MKVVQVAIGMLENTIGNSFVKRFVVKMVVTGGLPGSSAALKHYMRVRRMPRSDAMIFKKLDWKERDFCQCRNPRGIDAQVPDIFLVNRIVFGLKTENPERKRLKIDRFDGYDLFPQACPYFGNGFIVLKFQSAYFRRY
ncbi:hypothetical protein D3C87_1605930 [compost metagenome]